MEAAVVLERGLDSAGLGFLEHVVEWSSNRDRGTGFWSLLAVGNVVVVSAFCQDFFNHFGLLLVGGGQVEFLDSWTILRDFTVAIFSYGVIKLSSWPDPHTFSLLFLTDPIFLKLTDIQIAMIKHIPMLGASNQLFRIIVIKLLIPQMLLGQVVMGLLEVGCLLLVVD